MLYFRLLLFCCISLFLIIKDIKSFILPDLYIILLFICLLFFDLFFNKEYIFLGIIGLIFAGTFFLIAYYSSGKKLGFGDVKYAAVIGYFLGIKYWVFAIILACFIAIIYFFVGHILWKWETHKKIPFGPFLAIGSVVINLWSIL